MWSQWLARTLRPRRAKAETVVVRDRRLGFQALPDLECDGMHPGADEYRSAVERAKEDAPSA